MMRAIKALLDVVTKIPAVDRLGAAQRILDAQLAAEDEGSSLTEAEIRAMAHDAGIPLEELDGRSTESLAPEAHPTTGPHPTAGSHPLGI